MSSPSSPGYLPQYLLGGNSPAASPFPRARPLGSSIGSYNGSPGQAGTFSSPRQYQHQFGTPLRSQGLGNKLDRTPARSSTVDCTPKDSISAPPVEGLYDARSSDFTNSPFNREQQMDVTMATAVMTSVRKSSGYSTPGGNATMSGVDSQHFSPQHGPLSSPTQIDPFYTQGMAISSDDILDECWVTVFGFPPAASSFILQQFSQYGNIMKSVTSKGNWLHLQYQSKLQAKKALSKNGKIYGSNIMVGVMPCIEKSVMETFGKENMSTPLSSNRNETMMTSPTASKPVPVRPLTAAYQAARSDHQVVSNGARTPQKDANIVSKAMEYIFGW
ncbi:nucleoporin NUP35-like isoform X2 [Pocillopora damicornis]|nr:nucleoporin NUP35-like isoform X2 [Pocillopora damicornis]